MVPPPDDAHDPSRVTPPPEPAPAAGLDLPERYRRERALGELAEELLRVSDTPKTLRAAL